MGFTVQKRIKLCNNFCNAEYGQKTSQDVQVIKFPCLSNQRYKDMQGIGVE